MQNNELEKGLHDRLYDLEEAVNTDATWLAVQAGLQPPQKKRRGIVWWWLSGGMLLLALGGWLLWPEGDILHPDPSAEAIQEVKAATAPANGQQTTGTADASSPVDPATSGNLSTEENTTSTNRPALAAGASAKGGLAVAVSKTADAGQRSALPEPAPARRRPESTSPVPPSAQEGTTSVVAFEPKNTATSVTTDPQNSTGMPEVKTAETQAAAETLIASRQAATAKLAALPLSMLPGLPDDKAFLPLPPIKECSDCYTFGKTGKAGWTLGIAGGIAMPYRTIAAVSERFSDQRARNLAVERPLEAITADVLAGYHTSGGWTLRSGLSYQRVNSVAEARYDSTAEVRREGVVEIVLNPSGDTTFISGLITDTERRSGLNRYYNRLTTVDVPLLIGKTFRKGEWRFGVEAGPVLNLLSSGSARYQLADGTFSPRAQTEGLFRKRLGGISWRANVSAGIVLMPGLEASVGISALRRARGGFEMTESGTRTAYDLIGVQLGAKRSF